MTKYSKKIEKGNYIYYECNKRKKGCKGKCKFDKIKKKWFLVEHCSHNIIHDIYSYAKFNDDYDNKNLANYNMSIKKYQEYYTKKMFTDNNNIKTYNDIYTQFKKEFNLEFNLTQKEISDIKYNIHSKYNKLDFYELCKSIKTERDTDIEINSYDVKYKIIISNKEIERKEKIIFINTEKMRNLLNDINVSNYFMDFTYQIIPKKQKPYKLMTLTCVNNKDNISNICSLICLVYEDYMSIYYALKYLHDIYKFNPKFMHIDYSKAERKALVQKNLFDSPPIIISCFFHFT